MNDVSLDVHAGEILAVAGVQGNGRTELVRCIYGLLPTEEGRVSVFGQISRVKALGTLQKQALDILPRIEVAKAWR